MGGGWALTLNRAENLEILLLEWLARGEEIDALGRQETVDRFTARHTHLFRLRRATANLHSVLDIATAFWVWVRERERGERRGDVESLYVTVRYIKIGEGSIGGELLER